MLMREKRTWGGGSSATPGLLGPRFVALCLLLGLVGVPPVAGGPLVRGIVKPNHLAKEGIKDVQLIVTFTGAPSDLPQSGSLKLISEERSAQETVKGTYTVTERGTLNATFSAERGWTTTSYQSIVVDQPGLKLEISSPVSIEAAQPKPMRVAPDPKLTTDDILAFQASVAEAPSEGGAPDCKGRLYFVQRETSEPVDLKVRTNFNPIQQTDGLSIPFQLDRPSSAKPLSDAVLELCTEGGRTIYRGGPVEIVPLQRLEIKPQKKHGSTQTLWLEVPSSLNNQAQQLNAEILDGPEGGPALRKRDRISFKLQGDSYHAETVVSCPSRGVDLPELRIMAHDAKGRQYLLKSPEGLRICVEPISWPQRILDEIRNASVLWLVVISAVAGLVVCATIFRRKIWGWIRPSRASHPVVPQRPGSPPAPPEGERLIFPESLPETWRVGLAAVMETHFAPLRSSLQEIRVILQKVTEQSHVSVSITDPIDAKGERDLSVSPHGSLPRQPMGPLTEMVNLWWADGADRDLLDGLINRSSSVKPYRSLNVQNSMRNTTNRTFQFQPTENLAEWLGYMQQGELSLVPGDPKLFQTGDSLKFLGVLFEGLGSSLSNIRFRRVLKACRLKKEPGSTDRYRLAERGFLELEGGPAARVLPSQSGIPARAQQPVPAVQPLLRNKELAEVVQRAVERALPGGLPDQIQVLSQQVQILAQSGVRPGSEPQRSDARVTNLLNRLGGMPQEVSSLGLRMKAIEGIGRAIESLRESLSRIEEELWELHQRQPFPVQAAPVPSSPDAGASSLWQKSFRPKPVADFKGVTDAEWPLKALSPPAARDLRSEDWLKEIQEEINDVNPLEPEMAMPNPSEAPAQFWARLQRWWPALSNRISNGMYAGDPSAAYLWNLEEARKTLSQAIADRGWQIGVIHVKVPDNSPSGEPILQIHEPLLIEERRIICACAPISPFSDSLLFQFALWVRGDQGEDVAVLPAPGLRLTGSTEGITRLAGGKLPEQATSLFEVLRPAILSKSGSEGLYTIVLPMQANFR